LLATFIGSVAVNISHRPINPGVTPMSERKALLILHGKQALNEAVRAAVEASASRVGNWLSG
jgi:hypothetical protein